MNTNGVGKGGVGKKGLVQLRLSDMWKVPAARTTPQPAQPEARATAPQSPQSASEQHQRTLAAGSDCDMQDAEADAEASTKANAEADANSDADADADVDGLDHHDMTGVTLDHKDRLWMPIARLLWHKDPSLPRLAAQMDLIAQLARSPSLETLSAIFALRLIPHGSLATFLMEEQAVYMTQVLPFIARLALEVDTLFPVGLPLLPQQVRRSITLSQRQIACLLSHFFFCTMEDGRRAASYPHINFVRLHSNESEYVKLKFIFHYFQSVMTQNPTGKVTFHRQVVPASLMPDWPAQTMVQLRDPVVVDSVIENVLNATLADFANKYIGGGVLHGGAVQEEIMFLIMPELMATLAMTEVLADNEVLFMIGAQRYSDYKGYGYTLQWGGPHTDTAPLDKHGRRQREIVAMDALSFRYRMSRREFDRSSVRRELCKAYAAFCGSRACGYSLDRPIATGNWGCGAFNADLELKGLIQVMAASSAGRSLVYCPFEQTAFAQRLVRMVSDLRSANVSVARLYNLIGNYRRDEFDDKNSTPQTTLFQYISSKIGHRLNAD